LNNWLLARWLLQQVTRSSVKGEDDFDELLAELKAKVEMGDITLDQEHFWDAIAENDYKLLYAIRQDQLKSKAGEICRRYQVIREVAASPRQFRSVEEHLDFLCEITDSLDLDVANDIKVLKDCVIKLRVKLCA
jgi:hypothetical protein